MLNEALHVLNEALHLRCNEALHLSSSLGFQGIILEAADLGNKWENFAFYVVGFTKASFKRRCK